MSRISFIARNPKRALTGIAALTVAAGVTIGSGAFFEDQGTNNNNSVDSGRVDIVVKGSDGSENGSIFNLSGITPASDPIVRSMTVSNANSNDAPTFLRLCGTQSGDPQLLDQLNLKITSVAAGGAVLYNGKLGDFRTVRGDANGLGQPGAAYLPAGRTQTNGYDFTISMPELHTNQNAAAAEQALANFTWIGRSSSDDLPESACGDTPVAISAD